MVETHEQKHTFTEYVIYQGHAERTESQEFRKNKHMLVHVLDTPCWVCGSKDLREVHHLHEWALWGALNPAKVFEVLKTFDMHGHAERLGDLPVESPDDIRNLLVLCSKHHRAPGYGVHTLTFPIWLALASVKDGMNITNAISKVKEIDKALEHR